MRYNNVITFLGVTVLAAILTAACGQSDEACTESHMMNYKATITGPFSGATMHSNTRVSGDDAHGIWTFSTPEGELIGRVEQIKKDGITYARTYEGEDESTLTDWTIVTPSWLQMPQLQCASSDTWAQDGQYLTDASEFYASYTFSSLYGEPATEGDPGTTTLEEWRDSNDFPIRGRSTTVTSGPNGELIRLVTERSYYDFGIPNVITAPVLSTPTP